jgi:hypothetical protein
LEKELYYTAFLISGYLKNQKIDHAAIKKDRTLTQPLS